MKKIIMPFALAMMAIITITSCRKTTEEAVPVPGSVDQTTYLQLSANGVQLGQGQLYALVSVNNEQGQEVVSNKKVTLDSVGFVYTLNIIKGGCAWPSFGVPFGGKRSVTGRL